MSDAERIASFIALAEEELSAARLLTSAVPRQAAYFVQQAAEKAARAVLTAAGVPFGTSHNLGQMAAALPAAHPLRTAVNALDKYSSAATKYRYPNPAGRLSRAPAIEEVASSIDEVAAFIARAKEYFRMASLRPGT
jgi:HEPN domain-containing protein